MRVDKNSSNAAGLRKRKQVTKSHTGASSARSL